MSEEHEYLHISGYVPVKEAAEMLGISDDRVLQHIHNKRLPAKRVSGRYMILRQAVEEFKRNPPGRVRVDPPEWRAYNSRIKLLNTAIRIHVRAGQQARFEQKLKDIYDQQQHKFTGSAERFVFKDSAMPDLITIQLLWKDNEMPDAATREKEFEAFKAAFDDVLEWETAEVSYNEGIIYT
jgi:excisionase family DNA binding protein